MPRFEPIILIAAIAALAAASAGAAETVAYTYDAKGRLVKVERSGSTNNGVVTNLSFDRADNRTAKHVTGAP